MGGNEEMDMRSRKQYLETLLGRYIKADRQGKGILLDEYCRNTGQNRKYVIRKIGQLLFGAPQVRKVRSVQYGYEVKAIVVKLWQLFDYPCGQRLQPLVRAELDRLCRQGYVRPSQAVRQKLKAMGSATMDRLLCWRRWESTEYGGTGGLFQRIMTQECVERLPSGRAV